MSSTEPAHQSGRPEPEPMLAAVEALRVARQALADADPWTVPVAGLGTLIAELQVEIDALTGSAARWTKVFSDQDGPAESGAGSLATWLRRELRVDGMDAARRVRTAQLLEHLPATAKALETGDIGVQHVHVLGKAAHDLGPRVIAAAEPILLPVALAADPDALRAAVKHLRDTLDPDAADEAYVRALEQRDITLAPVGDLFHLRGVLDPITGQSLKTVLYALSKPAKGDDRSAGQRRVDALRRICDERLRDGVPTDHGHRPQLFVTVTKQHLTDGVRPQADPCTEDPAVLHGFGTIGSQLLAQLACDADQTEVVLDDTGDVLDVGRTKRLATPKQRIAIFTRQGGVCAAPGCRNAHLEVHHRVWWSRGGATDLGALAGYCTRCHHLIHQGLLVIKLDETGNWVHEDRRRRRLRDRWREVERVNRDHLDALAHQAFDGSDDQANHPTGSTPASTVDGKEIHEELKRHRQRRRRRRRRPG